MQSEMDYSLSKLKTAFQRLEEAARRKDTDLAPDAVVKRFEFTFELLWKTLKIILEDKGILVDTPKDSLQAAFRRGWITDDLIFLEMLKARNQMAHEYDEAEAKKVFKLIKKRFLKPIQVLIKRLDNF